MTLDNLEAIRKVDESNMLTLMEKSPERLKPPSDAPITCRINYDAPANVVLAGVGGSGIVGDVLTDFSRNETEIPISVCRSVKIPRFVGKKTLFVAISYSGETVETLQMLEQAKDAGAHLAAVCSGGGLLEAATVRKLPHVRVSPNLLPRVALPELVSAVAYVLGEAKVLLDAERLLAEASASMSLIINQSRGTVPTNQSKVKQAAIALFGHLPILIGSEDTVSVLRRFKNELNENSKMPAFFYTLPEAYHDDIEGLKTLTNLSKPQPVILRNFSREEAEQKLVDNLVGLLLKSGYPEPVFFGGLGVEKFAWLLSAITFGDFVSFYLAVLNGVDPSKLALIPEFKSLRGRV